MCGIHTSGTNTTDVLWAGCREERKGNLEGIRAALVLRIPKTGGRRPGKGGVEVLG